MKFFSSSKTKSERNNIRDQPTEMLEARLERFKASLKEAKENNDRRKVGMHSANIKALEKELNRRETKGSVNTTASLETLYENLYLTENSLEDHLDQLSELDPKAEKLAKSIIKDLESLKKMIPE